MSTLPDRRLFAYRPDLAEIGLRDLVKAARYTAGEPVHVTVPIAPLRPQPMTVRVMDTQVLLGENLILFDRTEGWCWVKSLEDDYVGYLPETCLKPGLLAATHVVLAVRTFVYEKADMKSQALDALSMGSRLAVVGEVETRGTRYFVLADDSAVIASHCRAVDDLRQPDYVAIAARFLETPYLWGGRSAFGLDCSGLVQLSMMMAGKKSPRDSDMQAARLGDPIDRGDLKRGDLVFWKGHVAIMEDAETLLHANGHTMTVAREALTGAIERIGWLYGQPTGYRRP